MSRYRLYIDNERTEFVTRGSRPAFALKVLVEMAGLELASQTGRYGKLISGGTVGALTESWGRVDSPDARTTRLR